MTRPLPPRPNLTQLKHQAKDLLGAHARGEAGVCATLRGLRRFAKTSDENILAADLALHEAQYALAIQYGFSSWDALKKHVESQQQSPVAPPDDGGSAPVFGERQAWAAVRAGVKDVDRLPDEIKSQIVSITVAGSLVRGDFIDNRSDVDIYTVLAEAAERVWESEAHSRIRSCFVRYFNPYMECSANPGVWDDVCLSVERLPRRTEDFAREPLKALGVYFLDFVKHHKTVWGEDFTLGMPAPVDPKPLIPGRLDWLLAKVEEIVRECYAELRTPILVGAAMTALQVYFSEEPSIHKSEVIRRYRRFVPDFPEKSFGLEAWDYYLNGDIIRDADLLPHSSEEYRSFLRAARQLVEQNPI